MPSSPSLGLRTKIISSESYTSFPFFRYIVFELVPAVYAISICLLIGVTISLLSSIYKSNSSLDIFSTSVLCFPGSYL